MKTLKIEIPQGYEIDKEKSTFENIVFKESKKELPKSWEDLCEIEGYNTSSFSAISFYKQLKAEQSSKNTFATKEQAEASIAMAQLSQLMKVYNDGWEYTGKCYSAITFYDNKISIDTFDKAKTFLSFKDKETAELFLENFRELIETAKPLL